MACTTMNYIATLLLMTAISLQSSFCSEDLFRYFVERKCEEYPKWLKENNSDPSTIVPGPTYIFAETDMVDFEGQLFNHSVSSLSQDHFLVAYLSNLEDKYISLICVTPRVVFKGDLIANGTILPSIPFSGRGQWNFATVENIYTYTSIDFNVTQSGYINITNVTFHNLYNPFNVYMYFEGLYDGSEMEQYAEDIKQGIQQGFFSYLVKSIDHPYYTNITTFVLEAFNNTSVEEIMAATRTTPATTSKPITAAPETTTISKSIAAIPLSMKAKYLAKYLAWLNTYLCVEDPVCPKLNGWSYASQKTNLLHIQSASKSFRIKNLLK